MQHDRTSKRSYLIRLCVSFLIIANVLALAAAKPDTGTRLNSIPSAPGLNDQSHPEGVRTEVSPELASEFIKKNSVVSPNSYGASATTSPKEVRVVYLVPSDRTIRQDYVSAIRSAIVHLQAFYQGQLGNGQAFSLHSPIVEVFQTSHAASFYSTGGNATQVGFWNSVLGDGFALSGGGFNDPNNRWIYYVDADPICGQVTGGTSGVALQGVTTAQHCVWAYVNGTFAGELRFDGQSQGQARFTLAMSQLREGSNVIRFVAQGGAGDVSLVDYTRISYWHKFVADDNRLQLLVSEGQQVTVSGFRRSDGDGCENN